MLWNQYHVVMHWWITMILSSLVKEIFLCNFSFSLWRIWMTLKPFCCIWRIKRNVNSGILFYDIWNLPHSLVEKRVCLTDHNIPKELILCFCIFYAIDTITNNFTIWYILNVQLLNQIFFTPNTWFTSFIWVVRSKIITFSFLEKERPYTESHSKI